MNARLTVNGRGYTLVLDPRESLLDVLRDELALGAAEQAAEDAHELWFSPWTMVELVEAATHSGQNDRATRALEVLSETDGGERHALGAGHRSALAGSARRRRSGRGPLP